MVVTACSRKGDFDRTDREPVFSIGHHTLDRRLAKPVSKKFSATKLAEFASLEGYRHSRSGNDYTPRYMDWSLQRSKGPKHLPLQNEWDATNSDN
jgi:hypothetical protein